VYDGLRLGGQQQQERQQAQQQEQQGRQQEQQAPAWRSWSLPGRADQVAGYGVTFGGGAGSNAAAPDLTFATVRGAGHMVPQTRPREMLGLLRLWLAGHPLQRRVAAV
jgi:hypothetical protein